MRHLTVALSFVAVASALAQPIDTTRTWVVNGDFEQWEGKSKLKRAGGIQYAKGWSSATSKKADLFSEVATLSLIHISEPTRPY